MYLKSAALGVLLSTAPAPAQTTSESFESGLGPWSVDSYVGGALPWNPLIVPSAARAHSGTQSLRFFADGNNDDGTLWIERQFSLGAGLSTVTLSFWMWSDQQADIGNWEVVGYLGIANPETESQFLPRLGETNQAAGWFQYALTRQFNLATPTDIWAAFGFNIVFEVSRVYYFDDTQITIIPAPGAFAALALASAFAMRRRRVATA